MTELRPKALCPVNNRPLVEWALDAVGAVTPDVTVNAWHHREQLRTYFDGRLTPRLAVESGEPLGTAGALGAQRDWLAGRPVLVHNADAWHRADLEAFVAGWDGERVRLLVTEDPERGDFGSLRFCGVSLQPWTVVREFPSTPAGLWEVSWQHLAAAGALDFVRYDGPYFDCGTPQEYLAANLAASGGVSVIGSPELVAGELHRSVVWPGAAVSAGEVLTEQIRVSDTLTVDARS